MGPHTIKVDLGMRSSLQKFGGLLAPQLLILV